MSKTLTIGIDARMYGLEHAGIGRYVKNIVREVVKSNKNHHIRLFLSAQTFAQETFPSQVETVLADMPHYSFAEQFKMPALLKSYPCDVMHFPHFTVPILYRGPYVVTIHDILWHTQKGARVTTLTPYMYYLKYAGYRLTVWNAVRRSRAIVTPSNWVADELAEQFGGHVREKITVMYEGVDDDLSMTRADMSIIKRLGLTSPFFIYTGSAYPHKNLERLIQAFEIVLRKQKNVRLVLVSSRTVFLDALKSFVHKRGLEKHVVFAGYVSDAQLKGLYLKAQALIHPSLSEGFGLTGLEAMSVGLPVISSDAGSLPEVYGDAVTYISPKDVGSMAQAMNDVLQQKSSRSHVRVEYDKLAKKYDWSKSGSALMKLYEEVANI